MTNYESDWLKKIFNNVLTQYSNVESQTSKLKTQMPKFFKGKSVLTFFARRLTRRTRLFKAT